MSKAEEAKKLIRALGRRLGEEATQAASLWKSLPSGVSAWDAHESSWRELEPDVWTVLKEAHTVISCITQDTLKYKDFEREFGCPCGCGHVCMGYMEQLFGEDTVLEAMCEENN